MHAVVNGARMHYERAGLGHPVVLIHDRVSTSTVWRAVLPDLARGHQVIVFDSRGVGNSELGPPGTPYTTELLADDVAGLLDHLGLQSATLAGISMGGGVAQQAALRHADRVAALILVSTSPGFSAVTRARMLAEADRVERGGIDAAMVETMLARWFTSDFAAAHPEAVDEVRSGVLGFLPAVFAARSRANAERDFTGRLGQIGCPVLFVAGADDPMGPAVHAATYRAALPDLEVRFIDGSSHLVPVQAAREISAIMADFIDRRHQLAGWPAPGSA